MRIVISGGGRLKSKSYSFVMLILLNPTKKCLYVAKTLESIIWIATKCDFARIIYGIHYDQKSGIYSLYNEVKK